MSVTLDADALSAGIERLPAQVKAAVEAKATAATAELQRHVIERVVQVKGDVVEGDVFVADGVPYAAILEHGGTTAPHDIVPDKGKALAFAVGGKHVFARIVHHPGSRFPARPYLASALDDQAEAIAATLKSAAIAAAQEAIG